jgi:hypothetical protein
MSSSSSVQLGGKGYRHKKNCKCRLCKKGGENTDSSSSSVQLGGKGYRHKKNCKCRLCKKGGENTDSSSYSDLEMEPSLLTESNLSSNMKNYSPDVNDKVGGKRRRKSRKQRKSRKSRKSRKTKKRRSHK